MPSLDGYLAAKPQRGLYPGKYLSSAKGDFFGARAIFGFDHIDRARDRICRIRLSSDRRIARQLFVTYRVLQALPPILQATSRVQNGGVGHR